MYWSRRAELPEDALDLDVLRGLLPVRMRNEGRSGNKAWLRRRLHAAIVREHLEGQLDDEA